MRTTKYIATKYETIRRTEKVEYVIMVPDSIRSKEEYMKEQLEMGNYISYKIVDVVDSEMLDDDFINFFKA